MSRKAEEGRARKFGSNRRVWQSQNTNDELQGIVSEQDAEAGVVPQGKHHDFTADKGRTRTSYERYDREQQQEDDEQDDPPEESAVELGRRQAAPHVGAAAADAILVDVVAAVDAVDSDDLAGTP